MTTWLLHTIDGVYIINTRHRWLAKPDGSLRGFAAFTPVPADDSADPFRVAMTYRFEGNGEGYEHVTPTRVERLSSGPAAVVHQKVPMEEQQQPVALRRDVDSVDSGDSAIDPSLDTERPGTQLPNAFGAMAGEIAFAEDAFDPVEMFTADELTAYVEAKRRLWLDDQDENPIGWEVSNRSQSYGIFATRDLAQRVAAARQAEANDPASEWPPIDLHLEVDPIHVWSEHELDENLEQIWDD